jgi:hypothetical protein
VRRALLLLVFLAGCRHPDDSSFEIVRVPVSAYGPFDAAIVEPNDAGQDASSFHPRAATSCVDPEGAPKHPYDAPFDNCETEVGHRALDVRSTARMRRVHPGACCYLREPTKRKIILDDME